MGKEQPHPQSAEQLSSEIRVTHISLDLQTRSVTLTSGERHVATLRLASEGLIFDATSDLASHLPSSDATSTDMAMPASSPEHAAPTATETERQKAITLQGKLKSKPREGRPDARGNPTAWARFAAHEPERDGAHLYSATFHKHTAQIALSLEKDAPLTVQGYPHEQADPDSRRLDTLSVITILDYPGKPKST